MLMKKHLNTLDQNERNNKEILMHDSKLHESPDVEITYEDYYDGLWQIYKKNDKDELEEYRSLQMTPEEIETVLDEYKHLYGDVNYCRQYIKTFGTFFEIKEKMELLENYKSMGTIEKISFELSVLHELLYSLFKIGDTAEHETKRGWKMVAVSEDALKELRTNNLTGKNKLYLLEENNDVKYLY